MMKYKVLFLLAIIGLMSFNANAQKGVRIGYIDTEYILQNVPEYQEASSQLDKKVLQWKSEVEKKLSVIEQKKKELENESVLLTKELYEERLEDISFEEAEILDYQQKRFGPSGDLMIQKRQLIEPIQDQIFAAVQEIATTKKYDFVFDKSADVVMLYSAERYDISEAVLRTITRTSKRSQAKSKKERKELEDEEVVPIVSEEKDARQQAIEDKKATREAELKVKRAEREAAAEAARKQRQELRDAKQQETEERRKKAIDARQKKSSPPSEDAKAETSVKTDSTETKGAVKTDSTNAKKPKTTAQILEEKRLQKEKDRAARKKDLDAKKQKILDQRKAARARREAQLKKNDSIAKAMKNG